MINPCRDCERKGCGTYHDECEQYQQYRVERELTLMKRNTENKYQDYKNETMNRMRKHKRNKSRKG